MSNLLNISSSPHVRDKSSTKSIMWDVFLALMPAAVFGIYNFSVKPRDINAILLIVVCIATCVLTEYIWQKAMKLPLTVSDGSAAVTGLLLALNLSSTFPIWMAIIGSVFAIIIVKQLFGGLGQNFMNPALGARCFLMVSFAGQMTSFTYDGVTGATPLAQIKMGTGTPKLLDMFLGTTGGTIGETSVVALLIGAAYLVARKVISLRIPVTYIVTFAIFAILFGQHDIMYLAKELCGGGLILGAFFMATDYVTSPITPKGQIVFGIILGVLTGVFRIFGASAEGVSYAIIISNLLVPLIERVTIPVPFGKEGIKDGK
ncbi:MAG: RnfABCDGE type electron transport complex subunit D [Lachnospiraceae bacterium]|nr:RnfABCDGE type electron transport complex subunit D [Lachnospiraceae bacterium]PWL73507.1 MAG: Na+-transporting NADH:ubiquinone oxidoreductase subunit D [Clostridiaceae bacterium]